MKRGAWAAGVGAISLVLIFAVLCLAVFSVLTLSTANSDRLLIQKLAASTKDYYQADKKAGEICAFVKNQYFEDGTVPEKFGDTIINSIKSGDELFVSYSCEQGEAHLLSVELVFKDNLFEILKWKSEYTYEWATEDGLDIWIGDDDLFG